MPPPTLEDTRTTTSDSETYPIPSSVWPKGVPIPGRGRGKLVIVSDEDEHIEDLAKSLSASHRSIRPLPHA